ncbi:MAG TPA: YIP1 family protein [Chloroflexia bacterium]|nr:YIP1 family protein [Chloroflexia bacterium]
MSYDPQSGGSNRPPEEPEGGYRASDGSSTTPPGGTMGGQPTQPVSGGYTPPPSEPAGGYTPPSQPAGGYTPPSEAAGGYTPPAGGGPTQPVGGYTPPPSGGYTPPPPPPGGGYTPPPPTGPVTRPEGGGAFDINSLFQSWLNALTKPNVTTYEAEIPRANWTSTLVGVALVAIVGAIMSLLAFGATAAMLDPFTDMLRQQDPNFDPNTLTQFYGGAGVGGAISTFIFTFVTFFLGAGLLWLTARMFGGTGSDFMTHSYLLSLSYTPTRVIAAVASIIPLLGGIVSFVLFLYQLYLAGLAMQASQRMQPGRAQMAAFLPTVVGIVLGGLCCLLAFGAIVAALGGLSGQ